MVGNEMGDTKTAGWVKYRKGWVGKKGTSRPRVKHKPNKICTQMTPLNTPTQTTANFGVRCVLCLSNNKNYENLCGCPVN